jgi:hypothetical protein
MNAQPRLRQATRSRARHAPAEVVTELDDIYRRLAVRWSDEQLAAHYRTAVRYGASLAAGRDPQFARPIALLATAIPPAVTLSVAIHVLHALPSEASKLLPDQLLETAERNAADALHRCHRALELDGAAHGYNVEEWLSAVYEIAQPQLQSARLEEEPPSVVQAAQEAIGWLSRAIVQLDEDAEEAATSMAETLARLLTIAVFTRVGRSLDEPSG